MSVRNLRLVAVLICSEPSLENALMSGMVQSETRTDWLARCRDLIVADYRAKSPGSERMFERARYVLPGGVSGNLRYFAPYPLYMKSGEGCRTTDVDGTSYIDCFSCNGPLLLGHRHPAIQKAVAELTSIGSMVVNPDLMVRCAEAIVRVIPSAERVRFLNSGTEAVMSAVRYARAFTGKDKIVKFFGHYHGQDDQFLLGLSPERATLGAGVPAGVLESTLTLRCNDSDAFDRLIASRSDIAAVIIDPAMHSGGLWGVEREFLALLRQRTSEAGIVLIFDEVITGFRMGLGGAQAYFDITPDLTTLAKSLSAGERLAAVVGSAAIMEVTNPLAVEPVPRAFQSGTGNDATLGIACALAAIEEYERLDRTGGYAALWGRVEGFEADLRQAFRRHGIGLHTNRICSMMQLFLSDQKPGFEAYAGLDTELLELFYLALINEGVLLSLPTSNHIYFSFVHEQSDFEEISHAVNSALKKYPFSEAYQQISKEA